MSWVRIDDAAPTHPKLLAAGLELFGFWVASIAYCNRQKTRDGIIPDVAIGLVYPTKSPRRLFDRGVDLRLFERVEGGYRVHDYDEYQPTADDELRRRRSEAGRIGGQRSGEVRRADAKQRASTNEAKCFDPLEAKPKQPHEAPSPPDPSPPDPSAEDTAQARYIAAYVDGVVRAKGSGFVFPAAARARHDLNSAIHEFAKVDGKPLRGAALLDWITNHADRFVRFVSASDDDPKFWSHYAPSGFLRWFNSGAPHTPRTPRAASAKQPPAARWGSPIPPNPGDGDAFGFNPYEDET